MKEWYCTLLQHPISQTGTDHWGCKTVSSRSPVRLQTGMVMAWGLSATSSPDDRSEDTMAERAASRGTPWGKIVIDMLCLDIQAFPPSSWRVALSRWLPRREVPSTMHAVCLPRHKHSTAALEHSTEADHVIHLVTLAFEQIAFLKKYFDLCYLEG